MKPVLTCCLSFAIALCSVASNALELGAEDFVAARDMSCVLAQDSLGYLSDTEFEELAEMILEDYDQAQGDVIYAQALGYFDGLMFGLPAHDDRLVSARLQEFVGSAACTRLTGVEGVSLSL